MSASEAKERFGQLLDRVEQGEEVTITRHGKEVAHLIPAAAAWKAGEVRTIADRLAMQEAMEIDFGPPTVVIALRPVEFF